MEYRYFKDFLQDQRPYMVLLSLFLFIVGMFTIMSPWLGNDIPEEEPVLLFFLSLLGLVILSGITSYILVVIGAGFTWLQIKVSKTKELPDSPAKLQRVTVKEKLLRYYDYRRFE